MGRCRCGDTPCSCSITSTNDNVEVTGSGTALDPYDINVAVDPAADNELQETANGLYVPGIKPHARCFRDNNQTIPNAVDTVLTYNQQRWDFGNLFDLGAPTRETAPEDGIYAVSLHIAFAGNDAGWRTAFILFNGTTRIAEDHRPASSGSFGSVFSIGTEWEFEAGQYIEGWVWQDSGSDLAVVSSAAKSPEMAMTLLTKVA